MVRVSRLVRFSGADCRGVAYRLLPVLLPDVQLQPNRILLPAGPDSRIVTTGGMAAWEDLALYLIARFYGEAIASNAAKLFLFGDHSEGQLLYAARSNCVERMVAMSGLSERSFNRRFRRATGLKPLEYVQTLRIEEAKHILETTKDAIDTIVEAVGYDDPASFRRLFKRLIGVTPGRYRQRYQEITRVLR